MAPIGPRVRVNPVPTSESIGESVNDATEHPDRDYWNRMYGRFGDWIIATRTRGLSYGESGRRDWATVLDLAKPSSTKRVLEIGVGNGRVGQWAAAAAESFTGLDVADEMLDDCARLLKETPCVVRLISGGASVLASECDGQEFDLIYSCVVMQHVSRHAEVDEYLELSARLLAPRGVAVHQLRIREARTTAHELGTALIRLPTRRPKFSRHWRGHSIKPADLQQLPQRFGSTASVEIVRAGIHAWLIIRRLAPALG